MYSIKNDDFKTIEGLFLIPESSLMTKRILYSKNHKLWNNKKTTFRLKL